MSQTYLILVFTLDRPRVELVEGSDRIHAGIDLDLGIKLGELEPLGGSLDVSGALRYAADEGAFYLSDPVIENLKVQGIPEKYLDRVRTGLPLALAAWFQTRPVYTLKRTDARQAAARLVLKDVVVRDKELVVTLGI